MNKFLILILSAVGFANAFAISETEPNDDRDLANELLLPSFQGSVTSATISLTTDVDYYMVIPTGFTGDRAMVVTMKPTGTDRALDAKVSVERWDGTPIHDSDGAPDDGTETLVVNVTANNVYFIRCSTGFNEVSVGSGNYTLSVDVREGIALSSNVAPYSLLRSGANPPAIDPTKRTWIVIHGLNSSRSNPNIEAVNQSLLQTAADPVAGPVSGIGPNDQILTFDWSIWSRAIDPRNAEVFVDTAGQFAANLLKSVGFADGSNLNLIGHSFGTYVAYHLAANMGRVNSIVALDPATDIDQTQTAQIDFSAVSKFSWAFHSSFNFGSNNIPSTAHEAFVVPKLGTEDYSGHSEVVFLFADLIARPSSELGKFFQLHYLLAGERGPWNVNQYGSPFNGDDSSLLHYEAKLYTDGTGTLAVDLVYTPLTPKALPASNVTDDSFVARWEKISRVGSYVLEISTSIDFSIPFQGLAERWINDGSTRYNVSGLEKGTIYYYRLRSVESPVGEHLFSSDYSNTVTVVPGFVPQITVHPQQLTKIRPGESFNLDVVAIGPGSLLYAWEVSSDGGVTWQVLANGGSNSGATTPTLSVYQVTEGKDGLQYRALVKNDFGEAVSEVANLTVLFAPRITQQAGGIYYKDFLEPTTYTVAATGSGPLSYRWTFNGNDLRQYGPTLTLPWKGDFQGTWGAGGAYYLEVSNEVGSVTSDPVWIVIHGEPQIISSNLGGVVRKVSDSVSWWVNAVCDVPLTYQWYRSPRQSDPSETGRVPFGTGSTLTIGSLSLADGDYGMAYYCEVSGSRNGDPTYAQSPNGNVLVFAPPVVVQQPIGQTMTVGSSGSIHADFTSILSRNAENPVPVTYQWRKNGVEIPGGYSNGYLVFSPVKLTDAGTYSVMFSDPGGSVLSDSCVVEVVQATPLVSWPSPSTITYGTPLGAAQLTATANVPGSFSYTPVAGTILNAGANQTLTTVFTPTDLATYATVQATTTLTVNKLTTGVALSNPRPTYDGAPHPVDVLTFPVGLSVFVTYDGQETPPTNAGTYAVTATINDANYEGTASLNLIIDKAPSLLSWVAPSPIEYGTSLSALQYNPSANVPGSFAFSPGLGTVLPVGSNTLTATFSPTDSVNYQGAWLTQTLSVYPSNTAPTISDIVSQTIIAGTNTGALAFTIGDTQTAATSLIVSGNSSNTTLVPNANIVFGGSGANRTVTVTPVAGQIGTAVITVSVSDGSLFASDTFTLTVNPSNTPPTISDILNQSINAGANLGALAFTISDAQTAAASLTVSGSSSNTTLVPNANIVFGGSGANRTVTVTPAAGQGGTATITVTVSDGSLSASDTFTLSVNTAPSISAIANQAITDQPNTGSLAFTVADAQTPAASLTVSGSSANTTLVPNANIAFGGSGGNRTVTITPIAGQSGTTTITLIVSDGILTASGTFTVTVNPSNTAPTISDIANLSVAIGAPTGPLSFTIGDGQTPASNLTVVTTSSNTALVPLGSIVIGGSGANRTVSITPVAGQGGTATITIAVSDGVYTASDSFSLSVYQPLAGQPVLYGIGDLPGGNFNSAVRDVARANGVLYAVGTGTLTTRNQDTAILWTLADGLIALPNLQTVSPSGTNLIASAITPDGAYIASRALFDPVNKNFRHAVRVTRNGLSNVDLGFISPFTNNSVATAISNDGSVLYGFARYGSGNQGKAMRFTASPASITAIPFVKSVLDVNNTSMSSSPAGRGTSADGSVMVGTEIGLTSGILYNIAFRYVHGTGVSAIPNLAGGTWNNALAVSPDGNLTLVTGDSPSAPVNGEFYLHNAATGAITRLGTPNGNRSTNGFGGMTADGAVVALNINGNDGTASYVHNSHGWHDFQMVAAEAGVDLTGWTSLNPISGMSSDGTLVWGSGTHNGNPEGFVVDFPAGYLASYTEPVPYSTPAPAIVGAWTYGDTTALGSGTIVFFSNGYYMHMQTVLPGDSAAAGMERGQFTWNAGTGAFTCTTLLDTNGDTGLSGGSGLAGITLTVSGDTLTYTSPLNPLNPALLTRVVGSSPIVGVWGDGSVSDNSAAIVFLPNGYYFMGQDGDSTPAGDPSGQDGMEWGTYAWDSVTGVLTAAVSVDTNGQWGLSHPQGTRTVSVSGNYRTLSGGDSSGSFSINRVGPALASVSLSNLGYTYDGSAKSATVTTVPGGVATSVTYGGVATLPISAGNYNVIATITDPNFIGSAANGTLTIAPAVATVAISNTTQTYDGLEKPVTVTTSPSPLTTTVTYNGFTTTPIAAGSYAVVATVTDGNGSGTTSATLTIGKATATIALSDLVHPYTGSPQPVTVTTNPSGVSYTLLYDGSAAAPSGVGYYPVTVVTNDPNYNPVSASATLTITDNSVMPTQASLYGIGDVVGAVGTPFNSQVRDVVRVNGVIYAVGTGSITNNQDTGILWNSASGGLTALPGQTAGGGIFASAITPGARYIATRFRLSDGSRHAARVTTSGLVNLDLGIIPLLAGATAASAISNDGSIIYGVGGGRAVRYIANGATAQGATATPIPFLYDGDNNNTPASRGASADGSVMVGTSSNSSGGRAAYRYVHGVGVSAIPYLNGGTWNVALGVSPDGNLTLVTGDSPSAPTNGEFYLHNAATSALTRLGTPNGNRDTNRFGGMTADGTVVALNINTIVKDSTGTIIASPTASYIHNSHGWHDFQMVTARAGVDLTGWTLDPVQGMSSDGTLVWGSGLHNGNNEGFVAEFPVGYLAGYSEPTVYSTPAPAIVGAWGDGSIVFLPNGYYLHVQVPVALERPSGTDGFERGQFMWDNGTGAFIPYSLTDTNGDIGLSGDSGQTNISITVAGNTLTAASPDGPLVAPRVLGSSPLVGTWLKNTSNLADGSFTAMVFLPDNTYYQIQEGAQVAGASSGMEYGTYTWDAGTGALTVSASVDTNGAWGLANPTAPLSFTVSADLLTLTGADNSGPFVGNRVGLASPSIALSDLAATYDGTQKSATVTTTPAGLATTVTYSGDPLRTNAGSYNVVATITDPLYTGSASGTLTIAQAVAGVNFSNTTQTYDGSAKSVTVNTVPGGLATNVTYDGGAAPSAAGTYAVNATVVDQNYTGSGSTTLTIEKASAAVTLSNLSQLYDASPKSVTVATTPTVSAVDVTYDGSATAPTAVGSYAVIATVNDANYQGSATGTLVIGLAPLQIITQPVNATVIAGQTATFTVVATGTGPISYQWRKGTTDIVGATSATLSIPNAQSADAGNYRVVVSNGINAPITSTVASLTVLVPPAITTQPVDSTRNAGQNASFTVTATGTATLLYQWRKDGADIAGATAKTLSLTGVTPANEGLYSVVVSNAAGSVTSADARLTVIVAPTITTQPAPLTVIVGETATFTVVASGTDPISYQWRKGTTDIPGATGSSYSIPSAQSAAAGNYRVEVSNAAGSVTSTVAGLTVLVPPAITTQPVDLTRNAGQNASFSVTATGTATLLYQWRKDGVDIAGATSRTLSLSAVTSGNEGLYSVVVSNATGAAYAVASGDARLTVLVKPTITTQPVAATVSVGNTATFTVVAAGTDTLAYPLSYQWKKGTTVIAGATSATYSFTVAQTSDAGNYKVTVSNAAGSVTSTAAKLTVQ